jgi:membrane protein required for colicin V production
LNSVDQGILALVALSALLGLLRGMVREVLGLVGLVLGILVALNFYADGARKLARWIADPTVAQAAAFFGVLILVWLGFAIVGHSLRRLLRFLKLGWLDRLGGLVFGLARGALLVSLLAVALTAFEIQPRALLHSLFSIAILDAGDMIQDRFPPEFRKRFREGVARARSRLMEEPGEEEARSPGSRRESGP